MQKTLVSLLGLFIVFGVVVVVAKDAILKIALQQSVTQITGFKTTVESVQFNMPSTLHIKGLVIRNPKGFKEEIFVTIPEIYASLILGELLSGKKIHLPEVRLALQEVHIERNAEGVSNVELLSSVKPKAGEVSTAPPAPSKQVIPLQLDKLVLTIRNVTYEDRAGLIGAAPIPAKKIAVDLKVQEEVFLNITDPKALMNVILMKILNSATLGRILDIDPKQLLGDNASKILNSGQQIVQQQGAILKQGVGDLTTQATSTVTNVAAVRKAEALVGSSVDGARNILGRLKTTAAQTPQAEQPKTT